MRTALTVAVATIMLATAYAPASGLSYGDFGRSPASAPATAVAGLTRADFLAPKAATAAAGACGKVNCTCGCEKGETCVCATSSRAKAPPVVLAAPPAPVFGGYPMPAYQAFGGYPFPPQQVFGGYSAPACAGGG